MQSYDVVILANSEKHYGHCIAGKDIHSGKWIRLINYKADSSGKTIPFKDNELNFCCGLDKGPNIMSIYRIPFSNPCPLKFQPENFQVSIDKWENLQNLSPSQLSYFIDMNVPKWLFHREREKNDRIPVSFIESNQPFSQSLYLLKLYSHNDWKIYRNIKNGRTKYRLKFHKFGLSYDLSIKDFYLNSVLENFYQERVSHIGWGESIDYSTLMGDPIYVTIGLGEAFSPDSSPGLFFHFKLVVGLIGSRLLLKTEI